MSEITVVALLPTGITLEVKVKRNETLSQLKQQIWRDYEVRGGSAPEKRGAFARVGVATARVWRWGEDVVCGVGGGGRGAGGRRLCVPRHVEGGSCARRVYPFVRALKSAARGGGVYSLRCGGRLVG